MSVKVLNYSDVAESSRTAETSARTTIRYGTRDYGSSGEIGSFEIRPALEAKAPRKRRATEKVVRRLNGFVIEERGEDFKVAFVVNGDRLMFYYLPAQQLRRAGIAGPNQPFQMDEMEIELDDARLMTGYVFCPLAVRSDSFVDAIDLNADRKRKFSAIVEKFGKPKT
jgi:hypothetical protein